MFINKGKLLVLAFLIYFLSFNQAHSYQVLDNIFDTPVFDLEGFISDLNLESQQNSIESTLVKLKEVEPHFFSNYVLMYKSRSLQTSSFMYPRVLLSSPNSTTVISYNGNPKDHGYENIEVMRFDPKTTKFVFNELSFLNGNLKLSKDNPKKCMNCHQDSERTESDPRPNWEPYSIWPGAYSSLAVGPSELSNPKSSKYDPILLHDSKIENEMYQAFLDNIVPNHPRYNLLKPMQKNNLGNYFPAINPPKGAPNRFTTMFTDELVNLNALRIARLISKTKIIKDYGAVIYGLAKCEKIYLPDEIFSWHKDFIHPTLNKKISRGRLADAIELIFHPYGISTQDWSMDFGTGGKFAFRHRFGSPSTFRGPLLKSLEIFMPEHKGKNCSDLENEILLKSFKATKSFRDEKNLEEVHESDQNLMPALISRCISCHTKYSFKAPIIPFDDELKLSLALKKRGYPRGSLKDEIFYRIGFHAQFFERMPADGYLPTAEEIKNFKNYLNEL